MKKNIPFSMPDIDDKEIAEVMDTLKSGWLTTGKKVHYFESLLKEYLGAKHVVALSSCTAALHVSLEALGVGVGDEVITSPFTFIATIGAIVQAGATPVLVDIDYQTANIDPQKIKEKITPQTKAIIPVHFGGHSCDMDAIYQLAKDHSLAVVDDAAHAIGARYKKRMIGDLNSETTCFSFYATKNLCCGEGGAVATNSDELARTIRTMSLHGITKDAWQRYGSYSDWCYDVERLGYKYNMTDVQASIGIHQIQKLDAMNAKRRAYAKQYSKAFSHIDGIDLPVELDYSESAWHLYPIRIQSNAFPSKNRDLMNIELKKMGIGTSVHFIPICCFPYMQKKFGFEPDDYPVAVSVFNEILSLPLSASLSEADLKDVIKSVCVIAQGIL